MKKIIVIISIIIVTLNFSQSMKWWKITRIIHCLSLTITNSIKSLYTVSEKKRETISPLVLVKLILFLIIIFSDACVNLLSLKNHSKKYNATYTPAKTLTITQHKEKLHFIGTTIDTYEYTWAKLSWLLQELYSTKNHSIPAFVIKHNQAWFKACCWLCNPSSGLVTSYW